MKTISLIWLFGLITTELVCSASGYSCRAWSGCSVSCGGGSQYRDCYDHWGNYERREYNNCNERCLHGYNYTYTHCQCSPYRTGSCCENCHYIDIPHCHPGYQECGGTPDGIRCTNCTVNFYSPGYNMGCKECLKVPNCNIHYCNNDTFSYCMECDPNYWLINNGTAEQFCFRAVPFPHVKCQGNCMIVYEEALSWNRARDVCEARGGHLYVPESDNEEYTLSNYVESVTGHMFGHKWFWIGGQLQQNDNIQWFGHAGNVDNWGYPRPHVTTLEPLCIGLDARDRLLWNAYDCDQAAYFVCEESTLFTNTPYVIG